MIASPESLGRFCKLRMDAYRRHQVDGLRKDGGPDPVIASNHFTNIYRELDPGTVLAMDLLRGLPIEQAVWTAVAYRLTNRRQVWEEYRALTGPGLYPSMADEDHWLNYLEAERAAGRRIFTGRHLNVGFTRYVQALQDIRHLEPRQVPLKPREFGPWLRAFRGIGQFFQWQVTADLMASSHLAPDPDYVVLGPGAKFGLRFISTGMDFRTAFNAAGRRVLAAGNGMMGDRAAEAAILALRTTQHAWLPPSFVPLGDRMLGLVDLEHALCEYGKWGVLHARREIKMEVPS